MSLVAMTMVLVSGSMVMEETLIKTWSGELIELTSKDKLEEDGRKEWIRD